MLDDDEFRKALSLRGTGHDDLPRQFDPVQEKPIAMAVRQTPLREQKFSCPLASDRDRTEQKDGEQYQRAILRCRKRLAALYLDKALKQSTEDFGRYDGCHDHGL